MQVRRGQKGAEERVKEARDCEGQWVKGCGGSHLGEAVLKGHLSCLQVRRRQKGAEKRVNEAHDRGGQWVMGWGGRWGDPCLFTYCGPASSGLP